MKKTLWIAIGAIIIVGVVLGMSVITDSISTKVKDEQTEVCVVKDNRASEWEEELFPDDEVIDVRIYMDESKFEYMSENAADEEYVPASVIYNGITIENIAIRPKGNSSLMSSIMEGQDGYSLHMKFDKYIDQDVYDIISINLNNCYGDDTYIRETLAYEIMEEMGLPVPERVFCDVYINDELFGVYLAVQKVDEIFIDAWFEDGTGDLYKPEGTGADLSYIDDEYDTYTGIIEKTDIDNEGELQLVNMLNVLNNGGDLDEILNVDMLLRYLAVNTAIINLDSYVGGMFHNYYLYGEDGKYLMIPWDLNETFMPFGASGTDTIDVTEFLIDEPTSGAVEGYPLVAALIANSDYLETYHEYLRKIIEGYMQIDNFTERVEELYALIDEHIEADPMASYEAFLNSLYETDTQEVEVITNTQMGNVGMTDKDSTALIDFVSDRIVNIAAQLSGEIPSTNDGQGNNTGSVASLISDDGTLDMTDNIGEIGEKPDEMEMGENTDGGPPDRENMPDAEMADTDLPDTDLPDADLLDTDLPDRDMPNNEVINLDDSISSTQGENMQYIWVGIAAIMMIGFALIIRKIRR